MQSPVRENSAASSSGEMFRQTSPRLPTLSGAFFCCTLLVVASTVAYMPVLFNFFVGDDFVHLDWLHRASANPRLLLDNFLGNWLGIPVTTFYRPLISVTLFADYLAWGDNGTGFHLTNLLFHIVSSCTLFFILRELGKSSERERRCSHLWPLSGAALFALHPLHPEVVSWITGRVDGVVTAFYLLSLWYYMQWRQGQAKYASTASLASYCAALMSKESAISLPLVCLLYELLVTNSLVETTPVALAHIISRGRKILVALAPWLLMSAVYLLLRRVTLGTFIGGYDDSLQVADWLAVLNNWKAAWAHIWLPANHDLVHSSNFFFKLWSWWTAMAATLLGLRLLSNNAMRRLAVFLALWTFISLLPVFKLLFIGPNLDGARHAYLATAPFSGLLTLCLYSLANISSPASRWCRLASITFTGMIFASSAALLWMNNQAWVSAGREANSLRANFTKLFASINQPCLFFGLPDNINGAYVCRNALGGLSGGRNWNIASVPDEDTLQSVGYIKQRLDYDNRNTKLFRWSHQRLSFLELHPGHTPLFSRRWSGSQLTEILHSEPCTTLRITPAGAELSSTGQSCVVGLDLPTSDPWSIDLIRVDGARNAHGSDAPELTLHAGVGEGTVSIPSIGTASESSTFIFCCYRHAPWLSLNRLDGLNLQLLNSRSFHVDSVEILKSSEIVPRFVLGGPYSDSKTGFVTISETSPVLVLNADVTRIAGAESLELECGAKNYEFDDRQPTYSRSPGLLYRRTYMERTAEIRLSSTAFDGPGFYTLRVKALSRDALPVGLPSDHIAVLVR